MVLNLDLGGRHGVKTTHSSAVISVTHLVCASPAMFTKSGYISVEALISWLRTAFCLSAGNLAFYQFPHLKKFWKFPGPALEHSVHIHKTNTVSVT